MQDPFGNYVVQYVLELGHVEATATIMRQLYGQYPELAQQKFSSNVVEKCLKLGGPGLAECRERVIRELMVSPLLPRLLQVRHVWAGYVLTLALAFAVHQLRTDNPSCLARQVHRHCVVLSFIAFVNCGDWIFFIWCCCSAGGVFHVQSSVVLRFEVAESCMCRASFW